MTAAFDRVSFARIARRALHMDGRGYRALATVIGITSTDLSRVVNGRPVSIEKVFAIADWVGVDARGFYSGPIHRSNEINVLQSASRETVEKKP